MPYEKTQLPLILIDEPFGQFRKRIDLQIINTVFDGNPHDPSNPKFSASLSLRVFMAMGNSKAIAIRPPKKIGLTPTMKGDALAMR